MTVARVTGDVSPFRLRDIHGGMLTEIWLVAAVTTIVGIRAYLYATGYPQVGGGTLHIAHMLWGGLGLTVALGMLLLFQSDVWKPVAAVVGGVGFGTFIDELGKFITKDNDYFFKPTIAIIYAIFILLFLIARSIERRQTFLPEEQVVTATEALELLAIGRLDVTGRDRALAMLDASGVDDSFTRRVRQMLREAPVTEARQHSRILSVRDRLLRGYWRLVGSRMLERIVLILFILQAISIIVDLTLLVIDKKLVIGDGLSFVEWGTTLTTFASGALVLAGVVYLIRRHRLTALRLFTWSVFISIFFAQFFAFAASQLAAFGGLLFQLVLLGSLHISIAAERTPRELPAAPADVAIERAPA